MDLEDILRRHIYDVTLAIGAPPAIAALADAAGQNADEVRAALQRLAVARILVLQPGSSEILMAPPFSAVPTPFLVTAERRGAASAESQTFSSYANCAWDALGVPVMMRTPARVTTACGCCGEAIVVDVEPDRPPHGAGVIHFAVPALRWWHDIVFT